MYELLCFSGQENEWNAACYIAAAPANALYTDCSTVHYLAATKQYS